MTQAARDMWNRYLTRRDERVRTQLLESYIGLVRHTAHRLRRNGNAAPELGDLIGAGTLGLMQAIEGFDPSRGLAFSTYAMPRIRGAILDEINSREWSSRSARARRRLLTSARAGLQHSLGRMPDPEQLARRMGVDLGTYWKWVAEIEGHAMVALDPVQDGGAEDSSLIDRIPDEHATAPGDELEQAQLLAQLRVGLKRLAPKDRLVLSLSFFEGLTLKEIGVVFRVSESRVSQIRGRALQRLRALVDA